MPDQKRAFESDAQLLKLLDLQVRSGREDTRTLEAELFSRMQRNSRGKNRAALSREVILRLINLLKEE